MDTSALTTEDRVILRHLAESPGWAFLIEHLFIPEIQRATAQLDTPRIDQLGFADIVRGEKRATMRHLDFVYEASGLPNPLEVHALGLLKAVTRAGVRNDIQAPAVFHALSSSGEVLCGKVGERVAESPEGMTCSVCQQMLEVRLRRGRSTFPV